MPTPLATLCVHALISVSMPTSFGCFKILRVNLTRIVQQINFPNAHRLRYIFRSNREGCWCYWKTLIQHLFSALGKHTGNKCFHSNFHFVTTSTKTRCLCTCWPALCLRESFPTQTFSPTLP